MQYVVLLNRLDMHSGQSEDVYLYNKGEYLIYNFTDLGKHFHYTTYKMTGKRVHNVLEIRAYIRGRSQHGLKPLDIYCEKCDIYWDTVVAL